MRENFPGGMRFVGLGQLPPEALRLLWEQRSLATPAQLSLESCELETLSKR